MNQLGLIVLIFHLPQISLGAENSCYDSRGRAKKCIPEFINAAFNQTVEATNTCGLTGPQEYCLQTGVTGVRIPCGHICYAGTSSQMHPPYYMTDFNTHNNWTWWQSETMLEKKGDWLNSRLQPVNLTLRLGKSFDVTYIRLRFHSPRPESFAIYKRSSEEDEWTPYQYYSASCGTTYNKPFASYVPRDSQDVATCSDEYSDISPLTGGVAPFSTLEGRPDVEHFESSKVLQEWVTATDIRIVLTRMNTFGNEMFGDPRVLRSYFYAIDDLAVGARCKCNGHAERCDIAPNRELVCECEHNTTGPDCNMCKLFYNDRPWARATEEDAMECKACDCNGMSEECYFDEELYRETGHGGHCTNCRDNRGGIHCDKCLPNHYVEQRTNRCTPCFCDPTGSEDLQCNDEGQCTCKPGVTGQRCDRCEDNYYDFGIYGCRACGCVEEGSLDNQPRCDSETGACLCKEFVEGQNCDRCKPGYFGLELNNPYGCISCFCYGHSPICTSATGYFPRTISTDFETGNQGWTGIDRGNNIVETQYNGILQNLGISAPENSDIVYFNAPARYLGDQRFSYNQYLSYKLSIGEEGDATPSIIDVIIEGAGQRISAPFYSQRNPTPRLESGEYKFLLNEHADYRWYPQLKSEPFISILANITAIKIRATYNPHGVGFIDDINLDTARRGFVGGDEASWIESCTCPDGYIGQFCESCAPGYKRNPPNGGPFASCVPCEFNGHSNQCDAESDSTYGVQVRLVDGTSSLEGRVEVFYNNKWGTICDDNFSTNDAGVICSMLGFERDGAKFFTNAYFGEGTGQIWLDDMKCGGNESSIDSCIGSIWGSHNCHHSEDVGVLCRPKLEVRLVGGEHDYEGRIEVLFSGTWGTVCDDYFGDLDAQVLCFMLGFKRDGAVAKTNAYFGSGSGKIWLDDLGCTGTEISVGDCSRKGVFGCHNCDHSEDAGVVCRPGKCQALPSVTNGRYSPSSCTTSFRSAGLACNLICNTGYRPSPTNSTTCSDTGAWSHQIYCEDIDECALNNANCIQQCINTVGSFECKCNDGYILSPDRMTCKDIDECALDNGNCTQQCINTVGSFECTCNVGYILLPDRTCKAVKYRIHVQKETEASKLPDYIVLDGKVKKGVSIQLHSPEKLDLESTKLKVFTYNVTGVNIGEIEKIWLPIKGVVSVSVYNPYINGYYRQSSNQELDKCTRQFGEDLHAIPAYSADSKYFQNVKDIIDCKLVCIEQLGFNFTCQMMHFHPMYGCNVLMKKDRLNEVGQENKNIVSKRTDNCSNQ